MPEGGDLFEWGGTERAGEAPRLLVDLDGYEGPIDVLLALAREQKVDLSRISILALVDQYLAFVETIRGHNLELAADYLVMAAWLAYLKSRLLLPEPQAADEPSGPEMAAALAFQLRRLEAMQRAGEQMMARPRLGRDLFARGEPEGIEVVARAAYDVSLYDLLRAYGDFQRRTSVRTLQVEASELFSVDEAIRRLEAMLGCGPDWSILAGFLPEGLTGLLRRSAVSATFIAALEMAKQGKIAIRQEALFAPIYLKRAES